MTSAFQTGPRPANAAAITILGVVLASVLVLVGITFFALSIAAPIALTVAHSVNVFVSQSDTAVATQLAALSPLFAVAAVASLVAALATIVKLIQYVSPAK